MSPTDDSAPSGVDIGRALTTPHAAAIAGILFGFLTVVSQSLIALHVSADELVDGTWLLEDSGRLTVGVTLIPFAGISFLWFIGVLRSHLGELEDQFYGTVFVGSGTLLVAMIYAGGAVFGAALAAHEQDPRFATSSASLALGNVGLVLLHTYGLKMAGVFLFSLGTMWLRSGAMPRWIAVAQFLVGAVLLVGVARAELLVLLFPFWIFVVSVYLLAKAYRSPTPMIQERESASSTGS